MALGAVEARALPGPRANPDLTVPTSRVSSFVRLGTDPDLTAPANQIVAKPGQ